VLFIIYVFCFLFCFFFSSRRRHTRSKRDWSSDVCSSDLDGIVVSVTTYDLEANKGKHRLWLVPTDGGGPRPLTSEEYGSTDPAVSPDGQWVSFTRARAEEKLQLHIMPLDGGEAERLTDFPLGVFDPKWFPDGKRIAFVAMLLDEAPTPEGTKDLLEKRAKDPVKVHITEDRVYRFWDHWLLDGERPRSVPHPRRDPSQFGRLQPASLLMGWEIDRLRYAALTLLLRRQGAHGAVRPGGGDAHGPHRGLGPVSGRVGACARRQLGPRGGGPRTRRAVRAGKGRWDSEARARGRHDLGAAHRARRAGVLHRAVADVAPRGGFVPARWGRIPEAHAVQ